MEIFVIRETTLLPPPLPLLSFPLFLFFVLAATPF